MSAADGDGRGFSFVLETGSGRARVRALHRPDWKAVSADWLSTDQRRRISAGKRQPLSRALGLHRRPELTIVDATAGLGRDGFTLAALGARVVMFERQPYLVALLRDAQARALAGEDAALRAVAERIEIVEGEAGQLLGSGLYRCDAVYLDPMYPDAGRTALPQKELQLLRELGGGDGDSAIVLAIARTRAERVAIKRPSKAPWVGGVRPDAVIEGTQTRYDVYLGNARTPGESS